MPGTLSNFPIEALHNLRTIDVPIQNNRLILVGENGTGKSTVANFIYYFLSQQWHRMLDYEFERVVAVIDNQELVIVRSEIAKLDPALLRRFPMPRRVAKNLETLFQEHSRNDLLHDRERLYELAKEAGVPISYIVEYLNIISREDLPVSENIKEVANKVSGAVAEQLLFLPTYRRIEQDLRSIFPGVDTEEFGRRMRERSLRRPGITEFMELVEFGMEDVEVMIKSRMGVIKDNVRTGLNNLTGTYLRDVIRGEYRSADLLSTLHGLDDITMEAILSRIPQAILSGDEQACLRDIIASFRASGRIADDDKVVADFLIQLISLYRTQQESEKDVREFVAVCNGYLLGKKMVYDDLAFETFVQQPDTRLEMRVLSSGEKQIVSLFSHIYFSGKNGYFVVIDEPELSLSVPWQKRFLPDILGTGRCNGLIAVTHSPFIFDNELDQYTHSIEEFVEPSDGLPR